MTEAKIENISDTARWVALYRAIETERPDAHFRDPFARRLAGERGAAIAKGMPRFRSGLWPMVVRTCLFDELIARAVQKEGIDTILNLAAGLDARPYRMPLPAATRWIDVDLPEILSYKQGMLAAERSLCDYEPKAIDLRDAAARRALFEGVGRGSRKTLVLSEGLLVYLTHEEVASLAEDLHAQPSFHWWVIDLASPQLLLMLRKRWGKPLDAAGALLQFAPAEGTEFFRRHGWKEVEFLSTWDESKRLRRQMPMAWLWRLLARFAPAERREGMRRFSGIVLLERL
ncbi:MAG: class I SAM-dependent methyltransferase [Acidobacteriota bacterium]